MIHRTEHSEDFTRLQNETLRDTRLSDGAFRVLIFMLTCSDDFNFSVKGLSHLLDMPERKVSKIITELKRAGYIEQKRQVGDRGRFLPNTWEVYETSTALHDYRTAVAPQHGGTALRSDRAADSPHCGKSAYIRTINIKELSNIKNYQREEEEKKTALGEFQNVFLTISEIEKLKLQLGDENLNKYIDALGDYLKEHPKKKYASHYRTILKWADRDRPMSGHCKPKETENSIDWDELYRKAEEADRKKAAGGNT